MIGVVLVSLAVLAYTYVGYPVVVGLLARFRPLRTIRDESHTPTLSVCIAAFNVERYLDAKLASVLSQDYPHGQLEVLVYSDGSTDGTEAIAERHAAADGRVRLIRGGARAGKPTGINRMAELAQGEIMLVTDARQPLAPGAIRALARDLADPTVACVTGNLVLTGGAGSGVYWRYENWIRRQEGRFRSVVGMTGPLSAWKRAELLPLPSDIILDDVWIPMTMRLRGKRVLLAEDAIAYDEAFEDEREFRRKVRTLAGNYQVFARVPALLSPFANPSWFETISHKVLRLLCPWALLGLLIGSLAVTLSPSPGTIIWCVRALFFAQVGFYIAAAVGKRAGRLAGVARTFVVLNLAAVLGLWRFLTNRQPVTW